MSSIDDINASVIVDIYEDATLNSIAMNENLEHMINETNAFFDNFLRENNFAIVTFTRDESYFVESSFVNISQEEVRSKISIVEISREKLH
jgi:molybdopterin-guanine dinucleotide biosynthesis protein A